MLPEEVELHFGAQWQDQHQLRHQAGKRRNQQGGNPELSCPVEAGKQQITGFPEQTQIGIYESQRREGHIERGKQADEHNLQHPKAACEVGK